MPTDKIPFTLSSGTTGYLSKMDITGEWFHVYVYRDGTPYYAKQLIKQQGVWKLPDSELEGCVGELVECLKTS